MSGHTNEPDSDSTPWFRRWFGEAYLRLYPHRDEAEATDAVRLFSDRSGVAPGARVLDLACGAGRHLRALDREGFRTVGLDLSAPLLAQAREGGYRGPLVRADMRHIPLADDAFGAVTSFFTSFGYFRSEDDDRRVLSDMRRVLRPNGVLLLDFLNAENVRRTLVPRDEEEIDGVAVVQERRLRDEGRAVEKTIRIHDPTSRAPQVFHERVRLYSRDELGTLLAAGGFEPVAWFGDYRGAPPAPDAPRTIVVARAGGRTPERDRDPPSPDASADTIAGDRT